MSAFLVSKNTIDAIVGAVGMPTQTAADRDRAGRMLLRQNLVSLASRYHDAINEEQIAEYRYEPARGKIGVIEILKALACYEYQACEDDGWETSEARRYCEGMRKFLVTQLPGYAQASWGLE